MFAATAVLGSDYESSVLFRPTFPAGSVNGSIQCVNITIIDDELFEADETILILTAFDGNQVSTSITIADNEGELIPVLWGLSDQYIPYVDVSVSLPATMNVTEGAGSVQVCATLSVGTNVIINSPIHITLPTSDGKKGLLMHALLCILIAIYN